MYCRQCGAQIPEDSIYCPSCGRKLKGPEAPSEAAASASEAGAESSARPSAPPRQSEPNGGQPVLNAVSKANDIANVGLGCGCIGVIALVAVLFLGWLISSAIGFWPALLVAVGLALLVAIWAGTKRSSS